MTNQELVESGNKTMDETDQAIERSKKVVEDTINIGAQTTQTLKAQTERMGRIVNELDAMPFSIKEGISACKGDW
ncbi:hypothetical protein KP509_02G039100 [Ceratopteris richardii]|uniref:Uncharacterized protein n=1 Tax=Ceratopteris richardii TaxID=49495 RepID=A0A8T2V8I8_CERRI|nr:hypothetical protein KP509_02G039100 [Ceratopteris richardii]